MAKLSRSLAQVLLVVFRHISWTELKKEERRGRKNANQQLIKRRINAKIKRWVKKFNIFSKIGIGRFNMYYGRIFNLISKVLTLRLADRIEAMNL
jgi:fatty-acid desaturase